MTLVLITIYSSIHNVVLLFLKSLPNKKLMQAFHSIDINFRANAYEVYSPKNEWLCRFYTLLEQIIALKMGYLQQKTILKRYVNLLKKEDMYESEIYIVFCVLRTFCSKKQLENFMQTSLNLLHKKSSNFVITSVINIKFFL